MQDWITYRAITNDRLFGEIAFRRNDNGWTRQTANLPKYLDEQR